MYNQHGFRIIDEWQELFNVFCACDIQGSASEGVSEPYSISVVDTIGQLFVTTMSSTLLWDCGRNSHWYVTSVFWTVILYILFCFVLLDQ